MISGGGERSRFENLIPATPLETAWWEKLDAWTEDERERLGLAPKQTFL